MPAVTFEIDSVPGEAGAAGPEVVVVEVPAGATVHEAACVLSRGQGSASGVPLAAPCGGRGRCGRCVVEFTRDPPPLMSVTRSVPEARPESSSVGTAVLVITTRRSTGWPFFTSGGRATFSTSTSARGA